MADRATSARARGYVRNRAITCPGGVALWQEDYCGGWKADACEVSADLQACGIPHYVTITKRMQSPRRGPATKLPPANWVKIWITDDDFTCLAEWMPSIARDLGPYITGAGDDLVAIVKTRTGRVYFARHGEELLWTVGVNEAGELVRADHDSRPPRKVYVSDPGNSPHRPYCPACGL